MKIRAKTGVAVFDDHKGNYYAADTNPTGGVKVPDTNTRIEITDEAPNGKTMTLQVTPSHA